MLFYFMNTGQDRVEEIYCKNTTLDLGLSLLTGSKLSCKFWTERDTASISYNEAEGLETEFAHSVDAEEWDTPDGIRMNLNLATDNNDANIETLDGKQTLHATVGYTYQNVLSEKIRSALKTLWSLERGETRESLWETSEKFLSSENL